MEPQEHRKVFFVYLHIIPPKLIYVQAGNLQNIVNRYDLFDKHKRFFKPYILKRIQFWTFLNGFERFPLSKQKIAQNS